MVFPKTLRTSQLSDLQLSLSDSATHFTFFARWPIILVLKIVYRRLTRWFNEVDIAQDFHTAIFNEVNA